MVHSFYITVKVNQIKPIMNNYMLRSLTSATIAICIKGTLTLYNHHYLNKNWLTNLRWQQYQQWLTLHPFNCWKGYTNHWTGNITWLRKEFHDTACSNRPRNRNETTIKASQGFVLRLKIFCINLQTGVLHLFRIIQYYTEEREKIIKEFSQL